MINNKNIISNKLSLLHKLQINELKLKRKNFKHLKIYFIYSLSIIIICICIIVCYIFVLLRHISC